MKKTFYSNGKLLLTGEYLILDGGNGFALPTQQGQNLTVELGSNQEIKWTSYDFDDNIWFEDSISFSEIKNPVPIQIETIKTTLLKILHEAYLLNDVYINNAPGYQITTRLTFPKKWGLGTSSTLINNIGQWLEIDAYTLLKNSFGGSGYDIACAKNNSGILFHLEKGKPCIEKVEFKPDFSKNIYFVYLNKKQSSKAAIASYYKNQNNNLAENILTINKITSSVINVNTIQNFSNALEKHEAVMSHILETKTVKEEFFPDFDGTIKSLGAWGGDFVMVVASNDPTSYFKSKGFETIIKYEEMILDTQTIRTLL